MGIFLLLVHVCALPSRGILQQLGVHGARRQLDVPDNRSPNEAVLDSHHMRMLVGILNLDRVQTNVEILVHRFEDACDAQIVFEFDDDRLVGQSLEHAEH